MKMHNFVLIGRYVSFGFTTRNWKTALVKRSQVRSKTTFDTLLNVTVIHLQGKLSLVLEKS